MKKLGIIAIIGLLTIGGALAAAGGWQLFNASRDFVVSENIEAERWDEGTSAWITLLTDHSSYLVPATSIMAGETSTMYIRFRNIAPAGSNALNLELTMTPTVGITNDVDCHGAQSTGLNFNEGTDIFNFQALPDGTWRTVKVMSTAAGSLPPGTYTVENNMSRNDESGTVYTDSCA